MNIQHVLKKYRQIKSPSYLKKGEVGIALVMTMLLGTTLMVGISALMVRQLAARKHVASESYRQIAELAANNGLNQILSTLNNDKAGKYSGYLLGLPNLQDTDNPENNYMWEQINSENPPLIPELCTKTLQSMPKHPDSSEKNWPTDVIREQLYLTDSIRNDGKNALHSYYRLRRYKNPPKSNQLDNGEATFIVEGLVKRDGMADDQYLARTRLERSLKVEAAVLKKREEDWAILFAENYELGETKLNGKGLIAWEVPLSESEAIAQDCGTNRLISRISNASSLEHTKIWPVTNQTLKADIFNNLFYINGDIDEKSKEKAWIINDTISPGPTNHIQFNEQYESDGVKELIFSQDDFCPGSTGDCHIYIEQIIMEDSKLYIENDKRAVVLHLINPSESNSIFKLSNNALICGVDEGQRECNQKPERLIITSEKTQGNPAKDTSCGISSLLLELGGKNIPYGFILLKEGSVELTSATNITGAIWARNICANSNQLEITVPDDFMESVYDQWGWKDLKFAGLGRSMSRTIRGSGYDTFKRY